MGYLLMVPMLCLGIFAAEIDMQASLDDSEVVYHGWFIEDVNLKVGE